MTDAELDAYLDSLPCWSDCPPGWRELVCELLPRLPTGTMVDQIKSKMGTLRVYIDYSPEMDDDAIDLADGLVEIYEHRSIYMCPNCGGNRDKNRLHPDLDWCQRCSAVEPIRHGE